MAGFIQKLPANISVNPPLHNQMQWLKKVEREIEISFQKVHRPNTRFVFHVSSTGLLASPYCTLQGFLHRPLSTGHSHRGEARHRAQLEDSLPT
jgi:hypothetical protein